MNGIHVLKKFRRVKFQGSINLSIGGNPEVIGAYILPLFDHRGMVYSNKPQVFKSISNYALYYHGSTPRYYFHGITKFCYAMDNFTIV